MARSSTAKVSFRALVVLGVVALGVFALGAFAFAIAPLVDSVVGVDLSEDLVAAGRAIAPANCELNVGDATALPFEYGSFDIAGCMRVLHHAHRPELPR